MSIAARGFTTTKASSFETGREAAHEIGQGFVEPPRIVLAYLTVNHDQAAFLAGLREVLGAAVPIVGCYAQGVVGSGVATEDGFGASVLGLGGDSIAVADACVEEIAVDTLAKGKALGQALRAKLSGPPKVTLVFFDPVAGADADLFLAGLFSEVESPIIGGGSAHSFHYGALNETYQYFGDRVLTRGAVAVALAGSFVAELGICHGCSPVGVEMTVTKADANVVLELDGRPAIHVWRDICGDTTESEGLIANLAIGVHASAETLSSDYLVRAAYAIDVARGGLVLGSAIPEGTRIMLHHRTTEEVLDGARRMAHGLRERLSGKRVRAIFCFECGARTKPFLGAEDTLKENLMIQEAIGAGTACVGAMFWGELFPVAGRPGFHNYSFPILAIADEAP